MCEETDETTSLTRAKITPNSSPDAEQFLYQMELETEKSSVPSSTLLSSTWGESKLTSEQLATPSQPSFDDDSSYESSSYQTPPVVQPSMTSSPAPALVNPKSGFSLPSVEALVELTPLLHNTNDIRSAVSEKQRQELLAQEDGAIPNHTDTLNIKEQHLIRSSVKNMFSDTIDTNSSSSQSSWTAIKSLNTGGMKQGKNDLNDILESAKDQPLLGDAESPDEAGDAVDRVKDTAEDTAGNFLIELSALKGLEVGVRGQTLGRCREPIAQLEEGDPENLIGQNSGDNDGILHEDEDRVGRSTILLNKAQEFADGVSFKRYWFNDQGKIFYLTPRASVPNPGYVDAVKQFIESSVLGHHVNWWPLKPLDTGCPEDYMRISWSCVCYKAGLFSMDTDQICRVVGLNFILTLLVKTPKSTPSTVQLIHLPQETLLSYLCIIISQLLPLAPPAPVKATLQIHLRLLRNPLPNINLHPIVQSLKTLVSTRSFKIH